MLSSESYTFLFLCDIDIVPSIQGSVLHVHSMGTWSFPDTRTLNALFRHCNTQSKIDSRVCGQCLLDQYAPF